MTNDKTPRQPRNYLVLRENTASVDEGGARNWIEVGHFEAHAATDAIKDAMDDLGIETERWHEPIPFLVAVPVRNFRPLRPTVETRKTIKFAV